MTVVCACEGPSNCTPVPIVHDTCIATQMCWDRTDNCKVDQHTRTMLLEIGTRQDFRDIHTGQCINYCFQGLYKQFPLEHKRFKSKSTA